MKVVFAGRKKESITALKWLSEKVKVLYVIALPPEKLYWKPTLWEAAMEMGFEVMGIEKYYKLLSSGKIESHQLFISYLFPYKIKRIALEFPEFGGINFHPAPLPELRGLWGYNIAILENMQYYGVSCHYMTDKIDQGDIIKVKRFKINPEKETAWTLERKTSKYLLELFYEVINEFIKAGKPLPAIPQGQGRYISRREGEILKKIDHNDLPDLIDRKIRAFFYPPYEGAYIEINGKHYTLINQQILDFLAKELSHDE